MNKKIAITILRNELVNHHPHPFNRAHTIPFMLCASGTMKAFLEGHSCNAVPLVSLQQMQLQFPTGTTCFLMERSAWLRLPQGSMPAPTITVCPQLSWLPLRLLIPCLMILLPWHRQRRPPLRSPALPLLLLLLLYQKPGRN